MVSCGTFDPVSLLPTTHPTQPSPRETVYVARQMRGLIDIEKDLPSGGDLVDIDFLKDEEKILEMREKHSEIIFQVERYCIYIFGLVFIFFNIFYWPYLLYA